MKNKINPYGVMGCQDIIDGLDEKIKRGVMYKGLEPLVRELVEEAYQRGWNRGQYDAEVRNLPREKQSDTA